MFQFWTAVLRKLDQKYHNVELGCYSGAFFLFFWHVMDEMMNGDNNWEVQ